MHAENFHLQKSVMIYLKCEVVYLRLFSYVYVYGFFWQKLETRVSFCVSLYAEGSRTCTN
jgi:hypothetical protein